MVFNFISANKNRLINSIQSVLSSALINVINIIIIGILINEYGEDEYGKYAFVYVTITLIGSTLGLSFGTVGSTLVAGLRKRNVIEVYRLAILSLALSVILSIIVSAGISLEIFPSFGLSKGVFIALLSLSIIMSTADSFLKSILIGLKRINIFLFGVFVSASINFSFLYLFKTSFGIYIGFISYLLGLVSFVAICLVTLKIGNFCSHIRMFRVRNYTSPKLQKDALLNLFSSILFPSVLWLVYFMLRNYAGNNPVAEFNLAYQFFLVITFVPTTSNRILLPYIVEADSNSGKFLILKRAVLINMLISLPVFLLIILYGKGFYQIFSSKIEINQSVIFIMSLAAIFVNLVSPLGIYLTARADFKGSLKLNTLSMFLLAVFAVFLVPKYQVLGAGISFLVAYFIHSIVTYIYTKNLSIKIS